MSTIEPIPKTNHIYYIIVAVLAVSVVLWIVMQKSKSLEDTDAEEDSGDPSEPELPEPEGENS